MVTTWQKTLGRALGYGLSMSILLIAQHFWNAASTRSTVETHTAQTKQAVAETDRSLAEMQRKLEIVEVDNVRLRDEAEDRGRIITSLKYDVAELKRICGIKHYSDRNDGGN